MNVPIGLSSGDFNDSILPSQYNDLIRRRSAGLEGEYRLLWAVLEEAIRSYLANMDCSTPNQSRAFGEVNSWLRPAKDKLPGLFSFQTICDLLDINSGLLLRGLESIRVSDLPRRRRGARTVRLGRLAA